MTSYTAPVGLPKPDSTDRVADGYDAIGDLADAVDDAIVADRARLDGLDADITAAAAARAADAAADDARLDALEAAAAAAHADTGWVAMTLAGGWVAYPSFAAPAYRKKAGIVYLKGLVRNGTPFTTMTTLPAGFRPAELRLFAGVMNLSGVPVVGGSGYVDIGEVAARINVAANGVINVSSGTSGSNAYVSLDSIMFPAEA